MGIRIHQPIARHPAAFCLSPSTPSWPKGSTRVVVVDDGSTDASAATAARHPCRLVRLERPSGAGAARNAGARAAGGDLLSFTDHDCTCGPDSPSTLQPVGTPVSNRTAVEPEAMIGLFINTLAVRSDLSGNPSFRQLLRRVRETALGAYTHQDLPFEQLLHHLRLERHLAYTPLFQVMFGFQTKPAEALEVAGLKLRSIEIDPGTAKFDLSLSVVESGDEIHAAFEYDTDLFDRDRVERMAGHFERLLQDIIEDPDRLVSDLTLLNEAERVQILDQWSVSQYHSAEPKCIHQLFECQVEKTPDAIAVVCGDETWTYRQLNERANQLARRLRELGVGPETLVGICLDRTPELMVALLATLKAGGAYVPLDPDLPQERLEFKLKDADCATLITQSRLLDKLPRYTAEAICLDATWDLGADESADNLDVDVTPDHSVYVIYT